jgi:hypothetical protein
MRIGLARFYCVFWPHIQVSIVSDLSDVSLFQGIEIFEKTGNLPVVCFVLI